MEKNVWYVSRQSYWGVDPDEQNMVEIAFGGLDYANADMLVSKYAGEGEEYNDPREAVTAAILIARQWRKDQPKLKIGIASGCTGGYTMPFEKSSVKELKDWAEKTWQELPKCDQCGKVLPKEFWQPTDDPDLGRYCSEYCCDKAIEVEA